MDCNDADTISTLAEVLKDMRAITAMQMPAACKWALPTTYLKVFRQVLCRPLAQIAVDILCGFEHLIVF